MTTDLQDTDPSFLDQLQTLVNKAALEEFADLRGTTRHLRALIDHLGQVDIHRAGRDGMLEFVCELSAKTANAIARQQTANAALMRAISGRPAKTAK